MKIVLKGATLVDSLGDAPLTGHSLEIENGRIARIVPDRSAEPGDAEVVDVSGKFVIPGLMNANVHLLCDIRLENIARHIDNFEGLIEEAAQLTLRAGLTTVFDTWGPRRHLIAVRDRIDRGEVVASRIFCAGNIIGFDGPFSADFYGKAAEVASAALTRHVNAIWTENVGRHLMWLSPRQVADEVRAYIAGGIDFVKYGANDHFPGSFLTFSPDTQRAIVETAREAGLTAQAHIMTVEGLRGAVEAGCDLIQHANLTGPVEIPPETLALLRETQVGTVVFPWPQKGLDYIMAHVSDAQRSMWQASDANVRNLIASGARLLLANDGSLLAPEALSDPQWSKGWGGVPEEYGLMPLATGHFVWLEAMEEKGLDPYGLLRAATSNIAAAYGRSSDLGSLRPGTIADLVVLNADPLVSANNYRDIARVMKAGAFVDRDSLPTTRFLTRPAFEPAPEEGRYRPFLGGTGGFPLCPSCACR